MPTRPPWSGLLAPAAFPAARYDRLGSRLRVLLHAPEHDVVLVPGEAVVALEAVAREAGSGGGRILNVATSVYGRYFGDWLRAAGARVTDLAPEVPGQPIAAASVAAALAAERFDAVAVVHGEAATGVVNPLAAILDAVRAHGAISIVDAVASFGTEPLDVAAAGADIVAIGPQKALGGPSGVSAVAVSARGWSLLTRPAGAPAFSSLSLLDLRRDWLDTDRTAIPGTPAPLELWALDAAVAAAEESGMGTLVARHRRASRVARAGLAALGLPLWVADAERSSGLSTGALLPKGIGRADVVDDAERCFGVTLSAAPDDVDPRLVRIPHTGARAAFDPVLAGVVALGAVLAARGVAVDVGAAAAAAADAHRDPDAPGSAPA